MCGTWKLERLPSAAVALVVFVAWSSALADPSPRPFALADADGHPLPGVTVSVVGRTGAVATRADGTFSLDPEPVPPFQLVVFGADGAVIGTIEVPALDDPGDRKLTLIPLHLETVQVVTGVAPTTIAPPAAAANLISRGERERLRPSRLVEILPDIPGADRSGPGSTAVPTLRGLARGRTLILLDDARVTAERRAGASATYVDPFALENLEVVRGPGSVAYGSDALGGVIHARTPRPEAGILSGRFETAAGAGEGFAAFGGEVNIPVAGGALLAQFHQRSFDDYDSPREEVDNSSARDLGGLVRGLIPMGEARLTLGFQADRGRDISRPARDSDTARTVYPLEDSDRFTMSLDLGGRSGFTSLELRGFLGRYRLLTERHTVESTTTTRTSRADVDADDASLRFVATRPVPRGVLRTGLDVTGRFNLHAENEITERVSGGASTLISHDRAIEDARRIDTGVFLEVERALGSSERSSVAAGLRGDDISSSNRGGFFDDRSRSDGALSGYAAFTWRVGEAFSTSVQVARGFRDPQLSDRYFRGVTARGLITGNPDLDPETTRQLDVAVRASAGPVDLALFGYLYEVRHLVERFEIAADEFAFRNRGEEEIIGLELEADLRIKPTISARATVGYARGTIEDDGSDAADIPPDSLTLSLLHRPASWWWQLRLRAVARDDRPGPTESVTPGHVVIDASLGLKLSEALELRLNLGNLTDKEFPNGSDSHAPLAPGRSAAVTLAGRF